MKYSIAGLAFAALAMAGWNSDSPPHGDGVVYETITTTAFTTYCPEATVFTFADRAYVVTEATTLTITDCPCTITRPISVETQSTVLYSPCPASTICTEESASPPQPSPQAYTPPANYSNPLTVIYNSEPAAVATTYDAAAPAAATSYPAIVLVGTGSAPVATPVVAFTGAASANSIAGTLAGVVAGVWALIL